MFEFHIFAASSLVSRTEIDLRWHLGHSYLHRLPRQVSSMSGWGNRPQM
jgi:hypothetical protein